MNKLLEFCELCCGGEHQIINDTLLIKTDSSTWKIYLKDKSRFNKYTLYHKSFKQGFHPQGVYTDLDYTLYIAYFHDLNKSIHYFAQKEDLIRWREDLKKFKKGLYR